ncbi:endo-1,4-beta-xylanase A precursor [Filimonas lacunae]|nr:endo-1,4-beta-xylanase A precursor [Filimonas lacunae]
MYIPTQFSTAPWNEWAPNYKYESTNFVIFWGAKVGANPTTYSDANLRFDPAAIASYLEASFSYYINTVGFHDNSGKLGLYKIIVVMNETYNGAGGPTGWAFGGAYDEMIGALWIHPNATRDPYVIAHELAHSLQNQNRIDFKPGGNQGGFNNYEPAGYFWETHANYMRCLQYPTVASDDLPRWLMTRQYYIGSTRHHYSTFKWLMNIQQNYGGINTVNRLWRESVANEVPTETWRRISGWTQAQLNDAMYDYAKREVNCDYPAQSFGADMRDQLNIYKTSAAENHWLWRQYTILTQISATTNRYIVPKNMAPQDQGINIIPLYPNCASNTVHVKFKGHTEVNGQAGWRWGFVEVLANGTTSVYGATQSSSDSEATYTLTASTSKLYLVVMGAPTAKHDYVWEPGWPRQYRYPYELRIENALPEGYQSTFRADVKALYAGHTHTNGGGWVANSATVASTVYVGPKAIVVGSSNLSGTVRVEGTARLESVTASSTVVFSGDCNVYGGTYSGSAQITDGAVLTNCTISGNTICRDNAWAWGTTYGGTGVVLGGDVEIGNCSTAGYYLQTPHTNNGRAECDGKGASDASNTDINTTYSNFTDAQMSWTAIGCSTGGTTTSNIAPLANATTSYVSSWETLSAVNDGYTPANSNDKTHGAYGNWNNPNSTQWVQYDWTQPYQISSTEVYWFDDAGGVLTPTTASIQYWNSTTAAWVTLGSVPRVKDANNVLTITPVQTSRLRVSMLNTTQSTGILEWRVLGIPVTSLSAATTMATPVVTDNNTVKATQAIAIYPNPARATCTIQLNGFTEKENVTLAIYDMQGKEVFRNILGARRQYTLVANRLAGNSSMYIVKAIGRSKAVSQKLVLVQ